MGNTIRWSLAGNWFSLMALLPRAVDAHVNLRAAADEPDQWGDFGPLLGSVFAVLEFVDRLGEPALAGWLDGRLTAAGIDRAELAEADVPHPLPNGDREAAVGFVSSQLGQPAFTDTGRDRVIRFAARGIRWRIHARNTFDDVRLRLERKTCCSSRPLLKSTSERCVRSKTAGWPTAVRNQPVAHPMAPIDGTFP